MEWDGRVRFQSQSKSAKSLRGKEGQGEAGDVLFCPFGKKMTRERERGQVLQKDFPPAGMAHLQLAWVRYSVNSPRYRGITVVKLDFTQIIEVFLTLIMKCLNNTDEVQIIASNLRVKHQLKRPLVPMYTNSLWQESLNNDIRILSRVARHGEWR